MTERLVIYRSGRNFRIRVETDTDGVLMKSEPYRSLKAAEGAAEALKRLWPSAEVVLPNELMHSADAVVASPTLSELILAEETTVRVRLTGSDTAPLDYSQGLALSDLRSILNDFSDIYKAASQVVLGASTASETVIPPDEVPDPRVRVRSGSVILEFMTEAGTTAGTVLSLFAAILKGPPAIAALHGKTKAAWHNAEAEGAEAVLRAEEAKRRLSEERGLARVQTKGMPELDNVRHLGLVQVPVSTAE